MIKKDVVYQKSAKGTEAVATRQHGLGPRLRSILILIDGKRGFDELAGLSQVLGDVEQLLGQLLDQGFIEPGAAAKPAAITRPTSAPVTLPEARRYAARRLTDLLGPNAEELCLRIEAARDARDLEIAVKGAEGAVRQFRGAQAAQDFSTHIQSHMPTQ